MPYFRCSRFRPGYMVVRLQAVLRINNSEFFLGRVSVNFIKSFLKDESGATMIEYGLVAALVSVAAIIALQLLGAELQIIFNTVSSYLASASNPS